MSERAAGVALSNGGGTGNPAEQGQATVELALVLPAVAMLVLLVLQAGLVAHDAVLVQHAAREAARTTAVDPDPGAARDAAVSSSGLDPGRLSVQVSGRGDTGSRATIQLSYAIPTDVPLVGVLVPDLEVSSTLHARVE